MRKAKLSVLGSMLIGAAVLAGCSSEGAGAEEDKVTIDVFQFKVEIKDQMEELAEKYQEENPDVIVNIQTLGGGSNYGQALLTRFSSGESPDIFNVAGPSEVDAYMDQLTDLSDTESVEVALDGTLQGVTVDDKVYGIPLNQEGYGLIYNKTVFEEAGINPDEILTYEDLEEATKELDSQKEALGIEAVYAVSGAETWPIGLHMANSYLAPEFNDDISEAYQAEEVQFSRADEFKRMLDLQVEYAVQPVLSVSYSQEVEELFSFGKVAMIKQGNWVYNTIYQIDPEFAENNIGIIPMPVEDYEGKMPVGVAMYWGVNSTSSEEEIQASKDFLDWLNTSEVGKEHVLKDFQFIPAYEGYDGSLIEDPISRKIYEYASAGDVTGFIFNGTPVSWPGGALPVNMQKYIAGEMTWEEAIADSKEKWIELR